MSIVLRNVKGSPLTYEEMDINLSNFYYSSSVSGTGGNRTITFFTTGSSTIGTLPDSVGFNLTPFPYIGNATITGSLTVTGDLIAERFITEFTSASIIYQSGSTKFGNSLDDAHTITGSMFVSNSLSVTGSLSIRNSGSNAITVQNGYIVFTELYQGPSFTGDLAAAEGGVPLGGLYRCGNSIQIRLI